MLLPYRQQQRILSFIRCRTIQISCKPVFKIIEGAMTRMIETSVLTVQDRSCLVKLSNRQLEWQTSVNIHPMTHFKGLKNSCQIIWPQARVCSLLYRVFKSKILAQIWIIKLWAVTKIKFSLSLKWFNSFRVTKTIIRVFRTPKTNPFIETSNKLKDLPTKHATAQKHLNILQIKTNLKDRRSRPRPTKNIAVLHELSIIRLIKICLSHQVKNINSK